MIRYETIPAGWPSSRRCGYRFASFKDRHRSMFRYSHMVGTTNGGYSEVGTGSEPIHANCSKAHGPLTNPTDTSENEIYVSPCTRAYDWGEVGSWLATNPRCPKGWGMFRDLHSSDTYTVFNAQGYISRSVQEPVYGYVTRYRTQYYNYITARVSKA